VNSYKIKTGTCPGDGVKVLLEKMLDAGAIRAALVPLESTGKSKIEFSFLGSKESLERAKPLAPYFFGNRALLVSRLTRLGDLPEMSAAVLRPCEVRSLVELKKLKQVHDGNLMIICADCAGTVSAGVYREKIAGGFDFHPLIREAYSKGGEIEGERAPCSICLHPAQEACVDIRIGIFGQERAVLVIPVSERGMQLIERLELDRAEQEDLDANSAALEKLRRKRKKTREDWLEQLNFKKGGIKELAEHFDACEQCRACSEICPVCYCKQCYFKLVSMETEPENSFLKVLDLERMPLPGSPIFFHLGRMTHMVHSCTGCGACSEACPSSIDVAKVFIAVGSEVQKTLDYEPGRNPEENLPLTVFKEDELEENIR
jgi:formate dehydrogenase subunit beta